MIYTEMNFSWNTYSSDGCTIALFWETLTRKRSGGRLEITYIHKLEHVLSRIGGIRKGLFKLVRVHSSTK